jgi:hypothetical protein
MDKEDGESYKEKCGRKCRGVEGQEVMKAGDTMLEGTGKHKTNALKHYGNVDIREYRCEQG